MKHFITLYSFTVGLPVSFICLSTIKIPNTTVKCDMIITVMKKKQIGTGDVERRPSEHWRNYFYELDTVQDFTTFHLFFLFLSLYPSEKSKQKTENASGSRIQVEDDNILCNFMMPGKSTLNLSLLRVKSNGERHEVIGLINYYEAATVHCSPLW